MLLKPRLSLRQKILLYCLIVLSPVVLLTYFLVKENSSYVEHHGLDSMSIRATLVQLAIDEQIDSTAKFLENLAQSPAVRARDRAGSAQLLSSILPLYPNISSLNAANADGGTYASVYREGTTSVNIGDRPYFQQVMQTGEPAVSGRLIGRVTDQPVFAIAVPIKDDAGQTTGVVVAGMSLKQVQQRLERLEKYAGDIVIVDADGVVLSHPNWDYVREVTILKSLSPIDLALSGKSGTVEYRDPLDGERWLWAYQPLAKAPWAVAVKYPITAVYSPAYSALMTQLSYALIAVAVALILALFLAERVSLPLRRLTHRMATAAPVVSVDGAAQSNLDDLHELTKVFNRVCSSLTQTSGELADVKEALASQAKKLELLTQRALEAREEERRRLAMNIHDGVLQLIAVAQGEARLARTAAEKRPDVTATRLRQLDLVLEQALVELRGMARGIHPPALEDVGLVHAIYNHVVIVREAFGIPRFSLQVSGDAYPLHEELEMAAFRIVQESLSNVGKHAAAKTANVFIEFSSTHLRVAVVDDGKGFDLRTSKETSTGHWGLANLRERAEGVGGRCSILSMPGMGTRVEVEIPLTESAVRSPAFMASAIG